MNADPDWEALIIGCSIPLRQLGPDNEVVKLASGCIVAYEEERILLTVEHATGNEGNWAIEVEFDPERGARLYKLGPMSFFAKFLFGKVPEFVDLAYTRLPEHVRPKIQDLNPRGEIFREAERLELVSQLDQEPLPGVRYGFAGLGHAFRTERELHAELQHEPNLSYLREEEGLFVFALNHKHPGDTFYKGCSGAPILSQDGDLVSLVVGGCEMEGTIIGVPLSRYRGALKVSLLESGSASAPQL